MPTFDDLAQLSNPLVPDLSPGASHLLAIMTRHTLEVDEAVQTLTQHPVIAARLIGLANSAWSAPVNDITSLKDACLRLGLSVTKSASIAYAVAAPFNAVRCPAFDPVRFWCCSLLCAEAASLLGTEHGIDPSVAKTAGLLQNLGLLWLADSASSATQDALEACHENPTANLAEMLTRYIGVSHKQATHHLLTVWGLGTVLRAACDVDSAAPLAIICRISARVASNLYLGLEMHTDADPRMVSAEDVDQLATRLGPTIERTNAIAQSIAA